MISNEQLIIIILGIILLVLLIGILILLITKKKTNPSINLSDQQSILNRIESLKNEVAHELEIISLKSKSDIKDELNDFKEAISSKVTTDVANINEKSRNSDLKKVFLNSDKIFKDMAERLTIIDTTQKTLKNFQLMLMIYQDYYLINNFVVHMVKHSFYQILDNVLGTNNKVLYEKQKKLSTSVIVDALVYGPKGIGNIPIDSKFPLEKLFNNE